MRTLSNVTGYLEPVGPASSRLDSFASLVGLIIFPEKWEVTVCTCIPQTSFHHLHQHRLPTRPTPLWSCHSTPCLAFWRTEKYYVTSLSHLPSLIWLQSKRPHFAWLIPGSSGLVKENAGLGSADIMIACVRKYRRQKWPWPLPPINPSTVEIVGLLSC